MPSDRWTRVERVFAEAEEQPADLREAFLARACGRDASVREEVASLLTAAAQSTDFLSVPALDLFARQIAREGWMLQAGDRVASYTMDRRLGLGGMGEVWRARDERLERNVAIKMLFPRDWSGAERVRVLQQEARAASALNHPNVLTVYDVGDHRGAPYLVMECLEGEALRARLNAGRLSVDAALDVARQVAEGLAAAHARGIVHRDLKPENLFLSPDGRVKILDFGLATSQASRPASSHANADASIGSPVITGTAGYMAPEQVRGEDVDARADIYALGAVLYEMLAGCRPFKAGSTLSTRHAVVSEPLPEPSGRNGLISPSLSQLVGRCLANDREDRFASVTDLVSALDAVIRARNAPPPPGLLALLRRPVVMAIVALVAAAIAGAGWWWRSSAARTRWARTVAAPEVQRLATDGDYPGAFVLAREALDVLADDPQLRQLWIDTSFPVTVTTDPPGADVAFAAYSGPTRRWYHLGRTPLSDVRVPRSLIRVRISKAGFLPIEGSANPPSIHFGLDPVGAVPAGMVRVGGGADPVRFPQIGALDDYFMDRFEVTNRQFKSFVDEGGYRRREFWREAFVEDGRILSWDDAIGRLQDATGRPGPATWHAGNYPDGQADFPVGGVSWYEAAAYAAFAGKSLPTVYHWHRAAGLGRFADILTVSNFGGRARPVGSYAGPRPVRHLRYGRQREGMVLERKPSVGRFLLGGGWNEPRYMFADYDAREPFERTPDIRLSPREVPAAAAAGVGRTRRGSSAFGRDARNQNPVSDDIFEVYRRQYAYDRAPLNAVVEATERDGDLGEAHRRIRRRLWRRAGARATCSCRRAGARRTRPSSSSPPPTHFACDRAATCRSTGWTSSSRSGRAVLYPVYKGTYERGRTAGRGPNARPRAPNRVVERSRTRHRLSRDANRISIRRVSRSTA